MKSGHGCSSVCSIVIVVAVTSGSGMKAENGRSKNVSKKILDNQNRTKSGHLETRKLGSISRNLMS
jgi:hypothetical protein